MVLTAAQTTAFFRNEDQMGIPQETFPRLANEGIVTVADLADFNKTSIKRLADNLNKAGLVFGAKCEQRLVVASNLVKYYNTTGRDMTAANIRWNNVMKNFESQWQSLEDKKEAAVPEVPKITKALPIIKWTEVFQDFLIRVIGVRYIPLSYVIRDQVEVPADAPPLATDQPYSTEHGSIQREMIARASHTDGLFGDDNASVYHYIEEATRSTSYTGSIRPFKHTEDGRSAWFAIVSQFAGKDKWQAEIKRNEQLLHTRVWKGQSNFTLESFIALHRNAFISMQACAQHVNYRLPNERSRVGFLLDAIQCPDHKLQAAMASIDSDDTEDGLRNNFEAAASALVPKDPVAKKRLAMAGSKRDQSFISGVEGGDVSAVNTKKKSGIGKTGVHFRFYTKAEYHKLSKAQKAELKEWREQNPDAVQQSKQDSGKKGKSQKRSYSQKEIASLVNKKVKNAMENQESNGKEEEQASTYIMSLIEKALQKEQNKGQASASSTEAAPSNSSLLHSILKHAKNHKA